MRPVSLPGRAVTDTGRAEILAHLAKHWDSCDPLDRVLMLGASAHGSLTAQWRGYWFSEYRDLTGKAARYDDEASHVLEDQANKARHVLLNGIPATEDDDPAEGEKEL